MIFHRQKLLLGLLAELGGEARLTDFQKLLFKYTREEEEEPSYDFLPYRFGCFSRTSYADKRKLVEKGYLADTDEAWVLAKTIRLPDATRRKVKRFVFRTRDLRGDALVRDVYRRYPEMAVRSEIVDRVLNDPEDLARIDAARPAGKGAGLATIGYEGKSQEAYLNALFADGVTILCDVRRNPLSRKYGFSKRALAAGCESIGIRYEHLPELGIPSEQRRKLETQADYDALFEDYEAHALPKQGESIEKNRWPDPPRGARGLDLF